MMGKARGGGPATEFSLDSVMPCTPEACLAANNRALRMPALATSWRRTPLSPTPLSILTSHAAP